jgi:acylphosphatase
MEKIEMKAIFKGNVQGVFFRQHVKEYAEKYKVSGYVKNLENGSVEVVAIADKNTLDEFIKEIQKKPGYGSIEHVETKYFEKFKEFNGFEIRY